LYGIRCLLILQLHYVVPSYFKWGYKPVYLIYKVLFLQKTGVVDPDPGPGAFLTPGSGMEKNQNPEFGMNIPDYFSESLETAFRAKNT
jgi:hypothetical protein